MNALVSPASLQIGRKGDFPGLAGNWAYLDTAATAQKPQAVIDAIARAYGPDYATVHRGVYERSATMTLRFEEARETVARFIGAGSADEVVFVRGATEGINLVAQSWGELLQAGDRILLSALEHHSNIVPWQLLRGRKGIEIDVTPLTADGRIDEDALEALLTPRTKLVSIAHVSNVLGGVADVARIARAAHAVGALLLVDGCQAAPRLALDVQALGCDFYVFSAHKLYGPTGIGVLWGRKALLESMPPWQGGGAMIETVTFERTTYAPPPQRFEAGTPHIAGVIGLAAAIDYVEAVGLSAIHAHEATLVTAARQALSSINSVRLFGPEDSAGILSFAIEGVHPHDIGTILDESGVAIRAGHHCAQPLMATLGVPATARASFGLYNDLDDVARLAAGVARVTRIFGGNSLMSDKSFQIEEVSEAAPVPKAPPLRAMEERSPDYLEGFLTKKAESTPEEAPGGELYESVIAALRQVFDPEIPVNIYDLGLIYGVDIADAHAVVTMTLTTPHCPVAETMPGEVELRVMSVPGIASAEVNLVWDPAWDPGKMSDEAKLEMGML